MNTEMNGMNFTWTVYFKKENDMKAIICDICGKTIEYGRCSEYTKMEIGEGYVPFDVCTSCCDDVRDYVKTLIKERKGE